MKSFLSLGLCLLLASPTWAVDWIMGKAHKLPSQYTNQESGYFSIIEGQNGKLYVGAAKYGENGYLLEFDPATGKTELVVDVMKAIGSTEKGFAAQAKIHTRNNVGASGKIYVGSKQGYPEKGETRDLYPGGYVITFDPKTKQIEHFGIAKPKHGIISVVPDEERGVAYISTCSDDRPIDHTHFMILDLKKKTYRDLGDLEIAYAFVVVDASHRAYHPKRGGTVIRFDPATDKAEELKVVVNGVTPETWKKDHTILNWDITSDQKSLYSVEMTTNELLVFDLTGKGNQIEGKSLGKLLPEAKGTDCRSMCVAPDGKVWMAVKDVHHPGGGLAYLVSYTPGDSGCKVHGAIGIANPDFTTFKTADGKDKPWHHTIRKEKDGTLTPWQPLGIAAGKDGGVFVLCIAPFTVIEFGQFRKK